VAVGNLPSREIEPDELDYFDTMAAANKQERLLTRLLEKLCRLKHPRDPAQFSEGARDGRFEE
jgi:hypothetical protein